MLLWFAISISLTLYNKWLFSVCGFDFPLATTAYQFLLKLPIARISMWAMSVDPLPKDGSLKLLLRVAPVGMATALDIACSNLSFLYITVTYYTITKSSVPLWILICSVLLGLQRCSCQLLIILLTIIVGITIATTDFSSFVGPSPLNASAVSLDLNASDALPAAVDSFCGAAQHVDSNASAAAAATVAVDSSGRWSKKLIGLVLVLVASMCAGIRWAFTQVLLKPIATSHRTAHSTRHERSIVAGNGGLHPLSMIYMITPSALAVLLPLAWIRERDGLREHLGGVRTPHERLALFALVSAGAFLGFFLILAELKVVQASSGLTLSIGGIMKEILTVVASVLLLGDKLTPSNAIGLLICLSGIYMYSRAKTEGRAQTQSRTQGELTARTGGVSEIEMQMDSPAEVQMATASPHLPQPD
jgi:solute carrier family 35 protein C2